MTYGTHESKRVNSTSMVASSYNMYIILYYLAYDIRTAFEPRVGQTTQRSKISYYTVCMVIAEMTTQTTTATTNWNSKVQLHSTIRSDSLGKLSESQKDGNLQKDILHILFIIIILYIYNKLT